jgi:hypothetical protein
VRAQAADDEDPGNRYANEREQRANDGADGRRGKFGQRLVEPFAAERGETEDARCKSGGTRQDDWPPVTSCPVQNLAAIHFYRPRESVEPRQRRVVLRLTSRELPLRRRAHFASSECN